MDNKFVIENCPCYWHIGEDEGCSLENMKSCKETTDCLLKKIYKLCKDDYVTFGGEELRYDTLCDIMELYKIKEVKEC